MAEIADELCPSGEGAEVLPFFIKTPNNRVKYDQALRMCKANQGPGDSEGDLEQLKHVMLFETITVCCITLPLSSFIIVTSK